MTSFDLKFLHKQWHLDKAHLKQRGRMRIHARPFSMCAVDNAMSYESLRSQNVDTILFIEQRTVKNKGE